MTDRTQEKKFKHDGLRQFFSCIVVFLPVMSGGMAGGWTSPTEKYLVVDKNSTIYPSGELTKDQFSWIASFLYFGGVATCLWWNLITETFGRKIAGYLVGIILMLSWFGFVCTRDFVTLLICRFGLGVSFGGGFVVGMSYSNEITSERLKGPLCSFGAILLNFGFLLIYVCGWYFSYKVLNLICLSVPVVFLIAFVKLPESPIYLMMKNKENKAKKSMMWFRGNKTHKVEKEMAFVSASKILQRRTTITKFFSSKSLALTVLNGSMLLVGQQISGITIITSYAERIFQSSGSAVSGDLVAIFMGILQVLGCCLPGLVINKVNQKYMLISTFILAALSLFVLGYSFGYNGNNPIVKILPIVGMLSYILSFTSGIGPIPFILFTRMYSSNIMSVGISLAQFSSNVSAFLTAKIFYTLVESLGFRHTFYILVGSNIFMAFYVWAFISDKKVELINPPDTVKVFELNDMEKEQLYS